ncbi:MAG: DnaJ domain-containing protein [Campylobacterota bacterium]|nr:DnaJ domain-containing protein [Campylobacterota bacterium]
MTQFIFFFLVGLFLVWVFRSYRRYEQVNYTQQQFQNFELTQEHLARSELGLFVALTAKIAKADGRVDKLEAELVGNMFSDISAVFPEPERTKEMLKEIFKIEKEIVYNIDEIALALQRLIGRDRHKRHMMMAFLVNLAYIDGHLSHAEEKMLLKIAAFLQFENNEIEAMLSQAAGMHQHATTQSSLEEAYTLLECSADDSLDTIKKRYRKLVRQYHPDIIKAQGADDDYIAQSTEKVQEINAAYEMVKKSRG